MSPITQGMPEPLEVQADSDMNTWVPVVPGVLQSFSGGRWAIYRANLLPPLVVCRLGGTIILTSVTGKATVWLGKKLVLEKPSAERADLNLVVDPGVAESSLSLLLEVEPGMLGGIGGVCFWNKASIGS